MAGRSNFKNQTETTLHFPFKTFLSFIKDSIKGNPNRKPSFALPVHVEKNEPITDDHVVWYGHSSSKIQLDGVKIALDPVFGKGYLLGGFAGKRFKTEMPIELDLLGEIDVVLISHNHYDHLHAKSIKALAKRVKRFIVPRGVAARLIRWGIPESSITELAWGEQTKIEGIHVHACPARHFSGRWINDRNATLWNSYVVETSTKKVFLSGDSGYGPHFKTIGEQHGPFDLTLMECGQYDDRWKAVHMRPEETVQAHIDVKGKVLLPIHWGAFILAFHDWNDPVKRAVASANTRGVTITTPKLGEPVRIGSASTPTHTWWNV
jgi:L-ascorbate metabolism protein UlaG (beta-lactamase superfamily)